MKQKLICNIFKHCQKGIDVDTKIFILWIILMNYDLRLSTIDDNTLQGSKIFGTTLSSGI